MPVDTPSVGRSRHVSGFLELERWLQEDAGIAQLVSDLNALDAACDSATAAANAGTGGGPPWYGAPEPGDFILPGEIEEAFYGRKIRIPFKAVITSGQWNVLFDAFKALVEGTFPNEDIQGPNRNFRLPVAGDALSSPAKAWAWEVTFE